MVCCRLVFYKSLLIVVLVVMLMSQSGVPTAKLCDLGLAKFWNGPAGYQSKHVGTERYWPNVSYVSQISNLSS